MKVFSPTGHGVSDCVLIIFLIMAPTATGFTGAYALACYLVAAAYVLVMLLTNFPLGIGRMPYRLHGRLELISGVVLLLSPFIWGFATANPTARNFFLVFGGALLLLWVLTDWSGQTRAELTDDTTHNLVGRKL